MTNSEPTSPTPHDREAQADRDVPEAHTASTESRATPPVPQRASREAGGLPSESGKSERRWLRTPPIDIFENEDGLILRADLPGVTTETLELQVQDNKLTLFGRVESPLPAGARLLHCEYHVGDFLRSFILSDDVDHERISATLTGGVLELRLPRAPKTEPRRIPVRSE